MTQYKDASYFMGPTVVNQPISEEEYIWSGSWCCQSD